MLPDKWEEKTAPPWDQNSTFDMYTKGGALLNPRDDYRPGTSGTGYKSTEKGTLITLKTNNGSKVSPSAYNPWAIPGSTGADDYRDAIANCRTGTMPTGQSLTLEPGNMVADDLKEPVGPEFRKTFDQQNFGLPLRDALFQLADRIPLMDVRFFTTAVLIQRDTGGNLAEILDNLSHVVRERFKIRRQIRVHTAHGRFTGWVLLGLPAGLGVILTVLNPDHMPPRTEKSPMTVIRRGSIAATRSSRIWLVTCS